MAKLGRIVAGKWKKGIPKSTTFGIVRQALDLEIRGLPVFLERIILISGVCWVVA